MPAVTLSEEIFVCAVEGKPGPIGGVELLNALAGAILIDLSLAGRVRISEDGEIEIVDSTPTGDALLDEFLGGLPEALDSLAQMGRDRAVQHLTPMLSKGAYQRTAERVRADGLVDVETDKLLGMISREKQVLTVRGQEVRDRVRRLLLGEEEPDARDAAFVGLLSAAGLVERQVPRESREAAKERAEALSAGDPVPEGIAGGVRSVKLTVAGHTHT